MSRVKELEIQIAELQEELAKVRKHEEEHGPDSTTPRFHCTIASRDYIEMETAPSPTDNCALVVRFYMAGKHSPANIALDLEQAEEAAAALLRLSGSIKRIA